MTSGKIIRNCVHCSKSFEIHAWCKDSIFCCYEHAFLHFFVKGDPLDCWNWTGKQDKDGYGHGSFGSEVASHRFAHEYFIGRITPGKIIRHLCNNRLCVNPNHLKEGTHKENMEDAVKAGSYKGERNSSAILTDGEVREIYISSEKSSVLVKKYDVSVAAIIDIKNGRTWLHITGAVPYDGIPKWNPNSGEEHHNVKLNSENVLKIYKSKDRTKDLAILYDISPQRVSDIRSGRGWNDITGAAKPIKKPKSN